MRCFPEALGLVEMLNSEAGSEDSSSINDGFGRYPSQQRTSFDSGRACSAAVSRARSSPHTKHNA